MVIVVNNFIPRQFKNIETKNKIEFNDIVKTHIQIPLGGSDFEKEYPSNISIILGEPASGKTYQLKEYADKNQYTHFVPLIALKENDSISTDTQVVLIDSIDEALTQNNQKILARELKEYILRCRNDSPKVKFVISCRFLEWSEYFKNELKSVDKELREYEILPLSKDDIDNLLTQKSIDSSDFWSFIDNNFLDSLLNNILITIYLIDNFKDYQTKKVTYIDIYYDLSKRYLSEKGEDRENNLQGIGLDKLLLIASSLATYLLLNRKEDIDSNNLDCIASELYKIDGENINESNLKIVLNSNLYKKVDNKFTIFHKSIQEYLMAYFIAQKNLNTDTIKKLFSSSLRVYEEFEEVIVYLTNLKSELFDEFVEFDPFIFKRHPALTKEEQEKLLLSILNKYKVDFSQVWGRWESFEGSTLVKFKKIDNLIEILKEHTILKEHGYYLIKLLENNYTDEIKEYMFNIFKKNIFNKKLLKGVIRGNFIDNYDFNISLYEFLKKYDLLEKDSYAFMMSFEAELFSSLYGIKYKYKYGGKRITKRTEIDINSIVTLLDFVPKNSLEYIAPYLLKEDAEKWFQYVIDKYVEDKYNYEFMNWVVYAVLKHCDSVESLTNIVKKIEEKKIYLHSVDKKEMKLDFKLIKNIFWQVYFKENILQDLNTNEIISLYEISLDDIIKATDKYPIKNHIKKYAYFRLLNDDIDKFLMQDEDFKTYMQNELKKQEEYKKELDRERKEKYPDTIKQKEDENLYIIECINRFGTKGEKSTDYHNIFLHVFNNHQNSVTEFNQSLQEKLSEKYLDYIVRIKQNFKIDILYKDIKNNLLSSTIYYDTIIYNYLFEVLDNDELKQIVNTKKDYIKLFWHIYKKSLNSFSDKFIKLSESYFDCFILISLQALKISAKQSENKKIGYFNLSIHTFKEVNKFNKNSMKPIIHYLINNKNIILNLKEFYEKKYLLEVLTLDSSNYLYILELMSLYKDNMSIYLQYLLKMDTNRALEDFYKIYKKEKRYKSIWERVILRLTNEKEVGYDNQVINPKKIVLIQNLIKSIKSNKLDYEKVNSKYLKFILKDYYEFFLEYYRPKGTFSPDIYDNMYHVINNIWKSFESSTQHINLLEELAQDKNQRLSHSSKYALTKSYEQQEKDRNYSNSYYKSIFDKDDKMNKTTININGNSNNVAINNKDIQQNSKLQSKSDTDRWWIYSMIAGIIAFITIWWNFSSWKYAIVWGLISSIIVWKLNKKFRFRNIGYSLMTTGIISNILPLTGTITIPKNDWIYGIVKIGENNFSILLLLISIPFFILDYFENKNG